MPLANQPLDTHSEYILFSTHVHSSNNKLNLTNPYFTDFEKWLPLDLAHELKSEPVQVNCHVIEIC